MKIIQSYWSLPASQQQTIDGKSNGGWLAERYQYMAMALSCLLLQRYYGKVTLYTDQRGYDLLIDQLQLPYDDVCVCLDELNSYPVRLWALPKIYTYQLQQEPFMHVDSDVFIWGPFDAAVHRAPLIAQSPEIDFNMYRSTLMHIERTWDAVPEMLQPVPKEETVTSINAGVFGGNDIAFIQQYTQAAFAAVDRNEAVIRTDELASEFNTIIEQYYFYQMSLAQQKDIAYVVPTLSEGYSEVIRFNKVPFVKYVHLVGTTKRHWRSCQQVEQRLAYEFPAFYKKLIKRLDQHGVALYQPNMDARSFEAGQDSYYSVSTTLNKTIAWLQAHTGSRPEPSDKNFHLTVAALCEQLDPLTSQFIEDQFYLEAVAQRLHASKSCPARSRTRALRKLYRRLGVALEAEVMAWPLTLSPHVCLLSTNWRVEVFARAEAGQPKELRECAPDSLLLMEKTPTDITIQDLDDWNKLFVYFQGKNRSGNDLVSMLYQTTDTPATMDSNYQSVYEFLTMHLVYSGYLRIAT